VLGGVLHYDLQVKNVWKLISTTVTLPNITLLFHTRVWRHTLMSLY